ncbi:MAG: lipoprotein [Candidatus Tectimicrobiota bacterium]|nr:MAG: lipoprotein [Candidatus Tectomicrobia bacterium]
MRAALWLVVGLGVLGAITCARVTINVYFPAAQIRDAAEKIESEVRHGTPPPAETPTPPRPQSRRPWPFRLALGPPAAQAQAIDITLTSPAIRRLVESRKQRYPQLVPFFQRGALGENNRGLVEVRQLQGLSLQERARLQALVAAENADRQRLYLELAKANNLPEARVPDIAAIFAEVNRKEAQPGWWIQEADGRWHTK